MCILQSNLRQSHLELDHPLRRLLIPREIPAPLISLSDISVEALLQQNAHFGKVPLIDRLLRGPCLRHSIRMLRIVVSFPRSLGLFPLSLLPLLPRQLAVDLMCRKITGIKLYGRFDTLTRASGVLSVSSLGSKVSVLFTEELYTSSTSPSLRHISIFFSDFSLRFPSAKSRNSSSNESSL